MELTIRDISGELGSALKHKADAEGKSVNEVAVEALSAAVSTKKRDLAAVSGTWVDDPVFDEIRREHDQIDPDLWK